MKDKFKDYFNFLANQQALKGQPFDYDSAHTFLNNLKDLPSMLTENTENGCAMRAYLIQTLLQARDIQSGVVRVDFEKGFWTYHEAAYAVTPLGEKFVLDPTEFGRPVSKEEWFERWRDDNPSITAQYEKEGHLGTTKKTPADILLALQEQIHRTMEAA